MDLTDLSGHLQKAVEENPALEYNPPQKSVHDYAMQVRARHRASRGEARKMVQAGAVLVGENKVTDIDACIEASQIGSDGLLLRKGKKNYCRLILK